MTPSLPHAGESVRITIRGVRNNAGEVRVAICPKADFLKARCPFWGIAPARAGVVSVTIDGVPPGIYAAQAFHDEDGNGKLERTWLGLPKEGMGFSNDAPMRYGPPRFSDAAFTVTAGSPATLRFTIRYY